MSTFIFLWLQNQHFYKKLQQTALDDILATSNKEHWADIGCSTGLITRLAQKKGYKVVGYDLNAFSLFIAKLLSFDEKHIEYKKDNLFNIDQTFGVISATSLLSVVDNEKEALEKLISLLKNKHSSLVIIEPTKKMTVKNVQTHITDFKSWWYYKGLLLWAKAREGKSVSLSLYSIKNVSVVHKYYLFDMVRVSYLKIII